jgi:hypothetical protein
MIDRAKAVLTAEQTARFTQIEIWLKGPLAFTDADVVRELDLTDQQKEVLKTVCDEYTSAVDALQKQLRPARGVVRTNDGGVRLTKEDPAKGIAEIGKQREEVRAAKEAECLAVRTDDQKAKFEKLRGPKFELGRGHSRKVALFRTRRSQEFCRVTLFWNQRANAMIPSAR